MWKYVVRIRDAFSCAKPGLELETKFANSIRIRTQLSDHIESQLFWQGFQEADRGVARLISTYLPRNGVFIDVGANIGSMTLLGAKVAAAGHVYAFEPSDHHSDRLAHNLKLNGFVNVTLVRKGVHERSGVALLYRPRTDHTVNNSGAASLYQNADWKADLATDQIHLTTLDDYVEEQGIARIDLVKIDIEGCEHHALRGGQRTLSRFRPRVLMELDQANLQRAGCSSDDILGFWSNLNYRVWSIGYSGELTPIRTARDLNPHQNLLCQSYSG